MFGSKLRSWMENHIVRPRKKGNKNKNANGNGNNATTSAAAGCNHEAYKKTVATGFTIYHGNGTTTTTTSITAATTAAAPAPAPASASEPSSAMPGTSANHNGCGSVIASPVRRREVSPIQNHSRYGWQSPDQDIVTSPKSDNFLYAPPHHRLRSCHTAPTSKDNSIEEKPAPKKQQQQQQQPKQAHHTQLPQPDCSSSSFSSLSWSTGSKEPSSSMHSGNNLKGKPVPTIEMHCSSPTANKFKIAQRDLEEDANAVHYEEIQTILRHPEHIANNNFIEQERPKSEQLTSFTSLRGGRTQEDSHSRYGRLLPSKMQPHNASGSIDSLNANAHSGRSGSAECLPCNNNQRSVTAINTAVAGMPYPHTQRGRFRNARYGSQGISGTSTTTVGSAPPMHSLSSPESAYSTGYSTDGTSPGAIYTPPEYYINMRTGTHYFPKSVNSLSIEAQRYKFGLNKIEEMSPIDPLPKTSFGNATGLHKRMDPFDTGVAEIPNFCTGELNKYEMRQIEQARALPHPPSAGSHSPSSLRNTIVLPTLQGFESPSPRQRCRIRTNPWYSTTDTSSSGTTIGTALSFAPTSSSTTISSSKSACSSVVKMELDAGSTSSSGIKSSKETEGASNMHKHNEKLYDSSESSSSLTEVENMQKTHSPNTIRRKRSEQLPFHFVGEGEPVAGMLLYPQYTLGGGGARAAAAAAVAAAYQDAIMSDDDATLNEMMGKFDESYVYEKETDILSSDSDPTDCVSDLDTGQDAEDECDTDELLDIDFIDTASMQEICEKKEPPDNLGNCYYFSNSPTRVPKSHLEARATVRSRRNSRNKKVMLDGNAGGVSSATGGAQRRRKRYMKTRKKSSEGREQHNSPVRKARESRSVGGTPVCLRKNNYAPGNERLYKTSALSNRSSSLVFSEVREQRFMTIAESEKALLKADLEADVKYRQLIMEAESILVSMKSSVQSIPRETPVASPRRVNPLANKRVEMLKNCEADTKRDHQKQQQQRSQDVEQELAAAINKRIELLKHETTSAPNSPKFNRLSPRKTHLTNFMNQNAAASDVPARKTGAIDFPKAPQSPQMQLNGRRMRSANASPQNRRHIRSHSLKTTPSIVDTDSESESRSRKHISSASLNRQQHTKRKSARNTRFKCSAEDIVNHNYLPEIARIMLYDESDYSNRNTSSSNDKTALLPFNPAGGQYCPQSEPLKRKVYKGSTTFERIKKSIDLEAEIPKQALLAKINQMRRERQNSNTKLSSARNSSHELNHLLNNSSHEPYQDDDASVASNVSSSKKQLILSTIADLKRSLENQSVELNGLNED